MHRWGEKLTAAVLAADVRGLLVHVGHEDVTGGIPHLDPADYDFDDSSVAVRHVPVVQGVEVGPILQEAGRRLLRLVALTRQGPGQPERSQNDCNNNNGIESVSQCVCAIFTLKTGRRRLRLLQVTPGELPDRRMLPDVDASAHGALAVHEKSEGEREVS